MIKKLIFGTANFVKNYGLVRNKQTNKQIIQILKYLKKKKIFSLDTSIEYRSVDKKIKLSKFRKWKIITKINLQRFEKYKDEKKIIQELSILIKKNAKNIGVKQIHTLLIQNTNFLLTKNGHRFFFILKKFKKLSLVNRIGYSIYNFNTIKQLVRNFKPDMIQCPCNIFDNRISKKKISLFIKEKKIEIHARSIFLKGSLLLKAKNLPKQILQWREKYKEFDDWIEKNNHSRLEVCINFVLNNPLVNKVIIGADNLQQLKQILNIKKRRKIKIPKKFFLTDENLLNPSKW